MSAKRFVILLILVLCLVPGVATNAAVRDGISWRAGCEGFTSEGGGFILTRDNTGAGREQFVISAVDGEGNLIFGPVVESFFVGGRISIQSGAYFPYSAAPVSNPILVTVVSSAGNGFEEETIYATIGDCPTLGLSPDAVDFVDVLPSDGVTSPSVPLNAPPPRPTNPEGIGATQAGYLIVNTSSANLRSGDSPAYTIVARVSGGTELLVLGVNERRTWWYVQVGDVRGWINNELVINRGDLTDTPIVPVRGEIAAPRVYLFTPQPVRIGPSPNAAVLCTIDADLEYFVVGQSRDGQWYQIEATCGGNLVTGWVSAEQAALRNSGSLPIPVTSN